MSSRPRVLIVGAGPAGLVLAHALARRDTMEVTVIDRDPSPFEAPRTTDRSYTIDITGHGLRAVQYLGAQQAFDAGLIRFRGIRVHRPIQRDVPWTQPGWTGSRGDILQALLSDLEARYPDRVTFLWKTPLESLDAASGAACLGGKTDSFDLIVGCDGAGSVTRSALAELPGFTIERSSLPNYCMMLELDQAGAALDPEWLQIINGHPFTVAGAVNGTSKDDPRWFCMVGFNHAHRFGSGCCGTAQSPLEEARQYFRRHTDLLAHVSDAELARFVERQCHHIGKAVRCSALHGGRTVLLGDAACAFPPVGQGINAGMESAVVFDEALGEVGGGTTAAQLREAAQRYDERWKPEADAALWIATRWTFSNLRMTTKLVLAEFLDCNVLSQAKSMPYSQVFSEAQVRLERLGPLSRLLEP